MKKLSFFLMAMLFSVMSFAAETVAYTLTPAATGGNSSPHNAYASAADWTYEGITWNVTGNSYMVPWRIGGKSITAQDRAVYTKTAMAADITKIEITHATVNITCNSCTLTVSDAANGAGETFPVKVAQNTTTTITLPEGDYSNKFYKLVYNVTNSTTSNKYVQLSEIKFYTEVQTSVEAPTFTPEEGKVAANNTFAEPFALTIASATTDATIKYTLDGTDPTLETALTYEAPITISTMVQVRAIAVKGEEKSVEASVAYIISSSEAKPYTASEAIAAEALGLTGTVYVTGIVKSIEELSTQYGNATYNITDGTKELKIYRGKNLENAKFTSADQLLVGDVVVVKGDLTSYNGAAQLGQNNYLISRITAPTTYNVTVTAENGTVTGAGEYEENAEATLTATANEGYEFTCWTSGEDTVSTANPYKFTVTADLALVANFELIPPTKYNVTVTAENGTVEGAGEYEENAEATLTATAAEGYEFVNWTVGDSIVSTENPYKFTVTADLALVANFKVAVTTITETFDLTQEEDTRNMGGTYSIYAGDYTLRIFGYEGAGTYQDDTTTVEDAAPMLFTPDYDDPLNPVVVVTIDEENNKEVMQVTATSADGLKVYNLTINIALPSYEKYSLIATGIKAENETVEGMSVIKLKGEGYQNGEEAIPFEFMVYESMMGYGAEGTIGEINVFSTEAEFFAEEGEFLLRATMQDEEGKYLFNVEVMGTMPKAEVEIVVKETKDVTLYNLNMNVQGNMAMVTAEGETLSFWLTLLETENYYGTYTNDAFSNIWYGDDQLYAAYGEAHVYAEVDGKAKFVVSFISTPDAEGNVTLYNFTLYAGEKTATGVENLDATIVPVKMIENGQLIIMKGDTKYNAQGAKL